MDASTDCGLDATECVEWPISLLPDKRRYRLHDERQDVSQRLIALVTLMALATCSEEVPDPPGPISQRVGQYIYMFDPRLVETVYSIDDRGMAVIRLALRLPELTQLRDQHHATGDDVIYVSLLRYTGSPILSSNDYMKLFSSWSQPSHLVASKYGLNELLPSVLDSTRLLFPADGRHALIQCSKATPLFHGSCDFDYRLQDLRVNLHFSALCLPYWREIEKESTDLITESRGRVATYRVVSARIDQKQFCVDSSRRWSTH